MISAIRDLKSVELSFWWAILWSMKRIVGHGFWNYKFNIANFSKLYNYHIYISADFRTFSSILEDEDEGTSITSILCDVTIQCRLRPLSSLLISVQIVSIVWWNRSNLYKRTWLPQQCMAILHPRVEIIKNCQILKSKYRLIDVSKELCFQICFQKWIILQIVDDVTTFIKENDIDKSITNWIGLDHIPQPRVPKTLPKNWVNFNQI